MRSTAFGPVSPYIGVDLTDRYATECRDIDVCGLQPTGSGLRASFWFWQWDRPPQPLRVDGIAAKFRAARLMMVDGPQALAAKGSLLRMCERQSAAVGKTPDTPPPMTKPFAGFIRSSLEFFNAMRGEGIPISPASFIGGVSEVYPGHIWNTISGGFPLARKSTEAGRIARKRILEVLGVRGLPSVPTHDQNDACLAALLAAVADNQILGVSAVYIGAPLRVDLDGVLREGPMCVPVITEAMAREIAVAVREIDAAGSLVPNPIEQASLSTHVDAEDLLARFIENAVKGEPQVCTYGWAYRKLFNASYSKFSMAYAQKAVQVACRTRPRELPGLGFVRLDTFIVSKKDGLPGDGYWSVAHHDREEWARVLGNATVLT